jgi:hypothetical protein
MLSCMLWDLSSWTTVTSYRWIHPFLATLLHNDMPASCVSNDCRWSQELYLDVLRHVILIAGQPPSYCICRIPLVSSFCTIFWMMLFDGSALWKQFLKSAQPCNHYKCMRKTHCSVKYIILWHNTWHHRPKEMASKQAGRHRVSVAKFHFHWQSTAWFVIINLGPLSSESLHVCCRTP